MTEEHKLEKVASALAYQRTVGVDNRIADLEQKLEQTEKDLADYQFNYPTIKELEKENKTLEGCLLAEQELTQTLEKEKCELLGIIQEKDKAIKKLIADMAGLEEEKEILERRISRAKNCMKKLLFIINSEPSNYNCKGLVQDAEDFIYNRTCNIRKSGNHCITEEPCIMCDKE